MISVKVIRIAIGAIVSILILLALLPSRELAQLALPKYLAPASTNHTRHLHLLVVATSSNLNLCRLLLSSSILSYPDPVLIDWEGTGRFNASETHLAKLAGALRYIEKLPKSQEDDLILMVDGYDIIFQLGPDVLLKRYYEAIDASTKRLNEQYGEEFAKRNNIRNTILFGPDKQCWPEDYRRLACYAVPDSPLSETAFGPDTDDIDPQHARPRWLNSGTIMGPAADMRNLFETVIRKVDKTFDDNYELHGSDQMYMSDTWGDQEYSRALKKSGSEGVPQRPRIEPPEEEIPSLTLKEDNLKPPSKNADVEVHIGLDYESRLFQTVSFYEKYIAWLIFTEPNQTFESENVTKREITIQDDVLSARLPFEAVQDYTRLSETEWTDVPLGVNVATGHIFPVLHFTGDKAFRDLWWNRTWFYDYAEKLLEFSLKEREPTIGEGEIGGISWEKNELFNSGNETQEEIGLVAWSDLGKPLLWDDLCERHEDMLFHFEANATASNES